MEKVKVIGSRLYQWELGRVISITPPDNTVVSTVEFAHTFDKEALAVKPREENGVIVADIPNILLQSGDPIFVFLVYVDANCLETTASHVLSVVKRPKPADYVYTETEVLTWKALDERLKNLEEQEVDPDAVANAVEAYMAEHPIKETDPTVPAWAKAAEKPTYTAQEVGALPADTVIPKDAFVVNVSADDSTIPVVYYTDKTSAEINQARQQGKFVYCVYNNQGTPMLLYPSLVTESLVIFTQTIAVGEYAVIAGVSIEGSTVTPIEYNLTVPSTLPNPHALTFTGAVKTTYDGSGAVSVAIPAAVTDDHINSLIDTKIAEIPSGGGELKKVSDETLSADVASWAVTLDKPYKKFRILVYAFSGASVPVNNAWLEINIGEGKRYLGKSRYSTGLGLDIDVLLADGYLLTTCKTTSMVNANGAISDTGWKLVTNTNLAETKNITLYGDAYLKTGARIVVFAEV